MQLFVTGASGVLGKAVVPGLLADGHVVYALGRSEANKELLQRLGAKPLRADLFDAQANTDLVLLVSTFERDVLMAAQKLPHALENGAVLITGASSGMGRACALRLDQAGYQVFATVRKASDAEALKRTATARLTPLLLDITDEASLTSAVSLVTGCVGEAGLIGLVNNAGISVTGPVELLPLAQLRRQLEINVIAQIAVTQAFLPLLRKAGGRILTIGSVGGKIAIPFGGPLVASKSALEMLNDALRMELHPWGIHVCLIAPGSVNTPAIEKLVAQSEALVKTFSEEGARRYARPYRAFVQAFRKQEEDGVPPEQVAEVVLRALTAKKPRTRYPVGPLSRILPLLARLLPTRLLDRIRLRLFGLPEQFGIWSRSQENKGGK